MEEQMRMIISKVYAGGVTPTKRGAMDLMGVGGRNFKKAEHRPALLVTNTHPRNSGRG